MKFLNKSRWLNAVSYSTHASPEELLSAYNFIEKITEVGQGSKPTSDKLESSTKSLNYGFAQQQVEQINIDCVHDQGYTGAGVYLAVIDAGFRRMNIIQTFDSVYAQNRVLDEYNFVDPDSSVYLWSGHGTAVSSCIVGRSIDTADYAGTAVDVDLALYLSEDVFSETLIEEFNLVAALERCDSVGVDIVNISLGYTEFDDSTTNHTYADMDGETTVAAVGVNVAVSKGIAVVSSAGNGGPGTISTPCDADSAFCVGAVDVFDQYAFFSSVGPSFDGQVKPDVAACGWNALVSVASGAIVQANGTSFSSPITAGAMACLIQANPGRSVSEIYDAVRESSSQFFMPDSLLGYGIPDFCDAHDILSDPTGIDEVENVAFNVFPVPATDELNIELTASSSLGKRMLMYDAMGKLVLSAEVEKTFSVDISHLGTGLYTVQIGEARKKVLIQE